MPIMRLYINGLTSGNPPQKNDHKRALRGEINGWSASASRSNTRFLYSVDSASLDGEGYAFTFTVKDLPPTPKHWECLRRKLLKRFERMGMVRLHWLTEWQRRGVPHLHGAIYFDHELTLSEYLSITEHWLSAAADFRPKKTGQHIKPITSAAGWWQYLSKHAARGVYHYQRNGKPESWEKTGRMWGKSGLWPTRMAEIDLTPPEFIRLRRLCRNWRLADARTPKKYSTGDCKPIPDSISPRRITSARKMLQHRDKTLCAVRGVSEWIPEHVSLRMLDFIKQWSLEND